MGIDNVKKEAPAIIKNIPLLSILDINYNNESRTKKVKYTVDGTKEVVKSFIMNNRDDELIEHKHRIDQIKEKLNNIDLIKYEQIYNEFNAKYDELIQEIRNLNRNNLFYTNRDRMEENLNKTRRRLIDNLLKESKEISSSETNTEIRICSVLLRKHLRAKLPNYTHISISTQYISEFNRDI